MRKILLPIIIIGIALFFWWQNAITPVNKSDTHKEIFVIAKEQVSNLLLKSLKNKN
jgi:hypothetical protein